MKILYFSSPFCGPCQAMTPIIEKLSKEFPIEKINVDEDKERAGLYNVKSIPTFIKKSGVSFTRKTGRLSEEQLRDFFENG